MNKVLIVLMIICVFSASCRKEPSVRRTDISGQVTHYGKTYAEQGIKVAVLAYYQIPALSGSAIPKVVDSAVTDANGNYSMHFSIDLSKVDSMYVIGFNTRLSTMVRVLPGKINEHIDLSVSTQLPVVMYDLHIINNDHPPLVLAFSPVDSIIVTAQSDNIKAYRVNSSLLYSSYAPQYSINASFGAYYYIGTVKKTQDIIAMDLPFQDTVVVADTINAATFK